jgi:choline dehydrogenase
MVYVRGHARDFDRWEERGNPGWGLVDVLPYFKKAENQERGPSTYHGVGGPQNVADPRWVSPISRAFTKAAEQVGIPSNEDFNGERQEGVGLYQLNQKDGERHGAADAYLRPALDRPTLTIESHARVTHVRFEGRRATGVSFFQAGKPREGPPPLHPGPPDHLLPSRGDLRDGC